MIIIICQCFNISINNIYLILVLLCFINFIKIKNKQKLYADTLNSLNHIK